MQATPATWRLLLESGLDRDGRACDVLCGGEALPRGPRRRAARARAASCGTCTARPRRRSGPRCAAGRRAPGGRRPSAGRSPTPRSTSSTRRCSRVPVGVAGRALHRRRRRGARLPEPARADRRALRARPLRPSARRAPLPHRRPGALAAPTASSSSSAASTTRSRCAASASSSARSRRRWPRHPGVQQVVVVAREDAPGDKRLVAYVVAGAAPAGVAELRDAPAPQPARLHGAGRLRRAASALPLHAQRQGRPPGAAGARSRPTGAGERHAQPPREQRTRLVARSGAQVLGLERVGVHDNFFDLGGTRCCRCRS